MDKSLYDTYYKYVCFYAYQLIGNRSLAEDVTQDAFLAYLQNSHKVSSETKAIKSFLYSSVRNRILNLYKKGKIEERYWEKISFLESDSSDYERLIIYNELLEQIEKLVSQLPPMCQQVMRLSFFEGLSNQEIIEKLDISINTIKTHRKRGIKYIQNNLDPELFAIFLLSIINY